jgi:hypothetical protein
VSHIIEFCTRHWFVCAWFGLVIVSGLFMCYAIAVAPFIDEE